jgi:hypothetical protein
MGAAPTAAAAGLGAGVTMAPEIGEGGHAGLRLDDDVAALPAIPAIGTATRDVCLPPEGGRAITAGAGGNQDPRRVSEHGRRS